MRVLILGAGAHGQAIADLLAESSAHTAVCFSDSNADLVGRQVLGLPVIGDDAAATAAFDQGRYDGALVGIGNTAMAARKRLFDTLQTRGIPAPTVVHPRATVAASAALGPGTVVFAGSVLGARVRLGRNVVIYSGSIVEHDCRLEDHAYLAPGVVLAGNVTVRESAFLGAGAVMLPGIEVGRGASVAAGAVVTDHVAPGATVAGVPARSLAR